MNKTVIIYTRRKTDSIIKKNQCLKNNPNAIVIESSHTDVISEALKGNNNQVFNFDEELDERHLKGDKVVSKKPAAKKETAPKKKAAPKKKETAKKPAAKKPTTKKKK